MCSENKGADQLRSYCEADLHLCFRKKLVSHKTAYLLLQMDHPMDFALMQWHVRIPILYVQVASVSASESSEILLVYAIKVI